MAEFRMSHEGRVWNTPHSLTFKRFGFSYVASKTKMDIVIEAGETKKTFSREPGEQSLSAWEYWSLDLDNPWFSGEFKV